MKKIFSLLIFTLCALCIWAHNFEVDGIYYKILTDKTNEVAVTYRGSSSDSYSNEYTGSVTIPSTVTYYGTTYSVTSIGGYAFSGCSGLTSVTIPNSVTSIGERAFYDCSGLTSPVYNAHCFAYMPTSYKGAYIIPEGIKQIAGDAFSSCSGLTSITIPNSVTSIEEYAFYDCSSLTSVTIGESVTSIGKYAFSGCSGLPVENNLRYADTYLVEAVDKTLSTYSIKEGTKWIGSTAFYDCSSLTSITIPNSVTSIEEYAFYGCSGLTSVTIPNSVTSIGERAFSSCSSLASVTIPNSVTSIGKYAFYGCSGLTSVTIPNSVTSIGEYAFSGCSSLTYLSIPGSVIYKKEYTNSETGEIESVDYYNGFMSILDCPNLKTLIVPADFFGYGQYYYNSNNDGYESNYQYMKTSYFVFLPASLESLTIHSGEVPRLGWEFIERNRKTLKTIDLGAITETSIPEEIFRNYFSLETLVLPSQLEYIPYLSIAECMKLQAITIPATVTEIADRAFEDCRSLKSIIFEGEETPQGAPHRAAAEGSALWHIGSWAFYNCHQLEHLTIPEGVTEVGDAAFYGCAYLEDMTLPSTVQEIGDNGFALCAKLQKIHVKATTPPTIKAKTFFDVNRRIPVYVPDEVVAAYESDPYWSEFDIQGESKAPAGVDEIQISTTNVQKLIRDGQLLIIREGKTYNAQGAAL